MTRVLVWVQHLLGGGHVERMRWVAEALARRGAAVTFVTGGVPLPSRMPRGVDVVQLPAVKAADDRFSSLVDEHGRALDDAFRAGRVAALLEAFERTHPDVVLLETFPFGRRLLRFELEPLLARVAGTTPRPRVVASVRDLLQRRDDAARDAAAWSIAKRWLDEILVHGDATFARLEETFPPAADGAVPVTYTGYVCAPGPRPPVARDRSGVVVSASGGDAGGLLLATAVAARRYAHAADAPWRVLVGPGVPRDRFDALAREGASSGTIVERHRDDFPALLAGASVAVTQAGYNTVLDVLLARTASVLVPFEAGGETEQRMRAERLEQRGRAHVLRERDLTPPVLAAAIDAAALQGEMPPCPVDVRGAERAAERILALAHASPDRQPPASSAGGA